MTWRPTSLRNSPNLLGQGKVDGVAATPTVYETPPVASLRVSTPGGSSAACLFSLGKFTALWAEMVYRSAQCDRSDHGRDLPQTSSIPPWLRAPHKDPDRPLRKKRPTILGIKRLKKHHQAGIELRRLISVPGMRSFEECHQNKSDPFEGSTAIFRASDHLQTSIRVPSPSIPSSLPPTRQPRFHGQMTRLFRGPCLIPGSG